MKSKTCPVCNKKMVKNGKTKAQKQRFRCLECGASQTHSYSVEAKQLKSFLDWLLSKQKQVDMKGSGRSFRRATSKFWQIWALPDVVDEIHRVVYVDGIYIAKNLVVLIAASDEYVLSWHLSYSENARSYEELLRKIAPAAMVVADGGPGFQKALKKIWPYSLYQRCLFHVFCQIKRYTTLHPRLQAAQELLGLARDLLRIKQLHQAELWIEKFVQWSGFWKDTLDEKSFIDGKYTYTHIRLRKAQNALFSALKKKCLFSYLDPTLTQTGDLPAFNNRLEGAINAPLREMLKNHRGLSSLRRVKAVFWWCYMHTENPLSAAQILKKMPTDKDIDLLKNYFSSQKQDEIYPAQYGDAIVWEDLHHRSAYPFNSE